MGAGAVTAAFRLYIVGFAALCGSVSLIYPFGRDQGSYGYAGWVLLDGGVPYRDVFVFKPPMTVVVHATGDGTARREHLGHSDFGHRLDRANGNWSLLRSLSSCGIAATRRLRPLSPIRSCTTKSTTGTPRRPTGG